jgi:hypothetical protein
LKQNGSSLNVRYSDIENGQGSITVMNYSVLNWGSGNIDLEPKFFDTYGNDYTLNDISPCIDAGTPVTDELPIPVYDGLGNERVWDGNGDETAVIDMGPYEYGSIPAGIFEAADFDNKGIQVLVYPNPFSRYMTLEYKLNKPEKVILTVYDRLGRLIHTNQEVQSQGMQIMRWNAEKNPPGVYHYTLQAGSQMTAGKIVVLK